MLCIARRHQSIMESFLVYSERGYLRIVLALSSVMSNCSLRPKVGNQCVIHLTKYRSSLHILNL